MWHNLLSGLYFILLIILSCCYSWRVKVGMLWISFIYVQWTSHTNSSTWRWDFYFLIVCFQINDFSFDQWLNSRTILLFDKHECAHVLDVDSQEGMETKTLDHVNLVYSSAVFKSIATGGNVSKALVSRKLFGIFYTSWKKIFLSANPIYNKLVLLKRDIFG